MSDGQPYRNGYRDTSLSAGENALYRVTGRPIRDVRVCRRLRKSLSAAAAEGLELDDWAGQALDERAAATLEVVCTAWLSPAPWGLGPLEQKWAPGLPTPCQPTARDSQLGRLGDSGEAFQGASARALVCALATSTYYAGATSALSPSTSISRVRPGTPRARRRASAGSGSVCL